MSQGGEKKSALGILLIGLFGLGFAAGGGYGLWVVIPKETLTTSVCVRSVDVYTRTTRGRKGIPWSSKELHLRGANQPAVFYHSLGTIFVNSDLVRRVNVGSCYRVELDKGEYEQHLNRPTGYGRPQVQYGGNDLPRVKMYSLAQGEDVFFTPFDAYAWDAMLLGALTLFGLFLMFCAGKAAAEEV